MQFRLTRRALGDLGLSIQDYASRPASDYTDAHDVVRVFVERRRQSPVGQEWTNLPVTAARAYNLHFGRLRALTWHDEDAGVVWLLGVGWHESGLSPARWWGFEGDPRCVQPAIAGCWSSVSRGVSSSAIEVSER